MTTDKTLPCPFCGGTEVVITPGETFRWRYAQCAACGSRAGEVRIQTTGPGTRREWEAKAAQDAIEVWNQRWVKDAT